MDYFSEAFTNISDFTDAVERMSDNYNLYAIKTPPNPTFVMNGSDICVRDLPKRYSFLFKLKVDSHKFAVTLFKIEDQFSITLDLCRHVVIVMYDDDDCAVNRREMRIRSNLTADTWHKIGLSFSEEGIELRVNCQVEARVDLGICSVSCNEDTLVSILVPGADMSSPTDRSSCSQNGGDGKVRGISRTTIIGMYVMTIL